MPKILIFFLALAAAGLLSYGYKEKFGATALPQTEEAQTEVSVKPSVFFSSKELLQGDTLAVKISSRGPAEEIKGKFRGEDLKFSKLKDNEYVALLGIDSRTRSGDYILSISELDNKIQEIIEVRERKFPVTELKVTPKLKEAGFTPQKIVQNIVSRDNPNIETVLSKFIPKLYFSDSFVKPLENLEVKGGFGTVRKRGSLALRHLGVDIAAETGDLIFAINSGEIVFASSLSNYGKTLILNHGFGIFSLYLHLDSFAASLGKKVKRGEIIGYAGNTGYSIDPHLHFSIKINGTSVDPLRFIEAANSVIEK